ncbi:uncharacterized protein LOC132601705 [Lycium barbarum]|uniref:uncharacterized protein LOC132601705 n=1 Tax=Lycium barbarum TaxID=112863 RepID=UPI00293F65CD|nr:uncharacterized protein LOC132601705 [Lycium barbarum]
MRLSQELGRILERVLEIPFQAAGGRGSARARGGGGDRGGGGRRGSVRGGGARGAGDRGGWAREAGGRGGVVGGLRLVDEPNKHAIVPAPAQQHPSTSELLSTSERPSISYRPSTPLYTLAQLYSDHIEWGSVKASVSAQLPVCHPQDERPVRDLQGGKELEYDYTFTDFDMFQSQDVSV